MSFFFFFYKYFVDPFSGFRGFPIDEELNSDDEKQSEKESRNHKNSSKTPLVKNWCVVFLLLYFRLDRFSFENSLLFSMVCPYIFCIQFLYHAIFFLYNFSGWSHLSVSIKRKVFCLLYWYIFVYDVGLMKFNFHSTSISIIKQTYQNGHYSTAHVNCEVFFFSLKEIDLSLQLRVSIFQMYFWLWLNLLIFWCIYVFLFSLVNMGCYIFRIQGHTSTT